MEGITVKIEAAALSGFAKCKRCWRRDGTVGQCAYQPVLCTRCAEVIGEHYPHMVPLEKPDPVKGEACTHHETSCSCWSEGLRFPPEG